jgi:hypothetical protein
MLRHRLPRVALAELVQSSAHAHRLADQRRRRDRVRHQDQNGKSQALRLHRDKRRYDITAGAAAQDLTRPASSICTTSTRFRDAGQAPSETGGAGGVFDTKKEQLTLEHEIVVTSSKGDEGYLSKP